TVLTEGQAEIGVAGQLKDEMSVPPLIQELSGRRAPHGQSTQHERARRERQSLRSRLPILSYQRDAVRLAQPVLGDNQLRMSPFEDRSGGFQPRCASFAANPRGGAHLSPQSKTGQKLVTVLVTIGCFEVFRRGAAEKVYTSGGGRRKIWLRGTDLK